MHPRFRLRAPQPAISKCRPGLAPGERPARNCCSQCTSLVSLRALGPRERVTVPFQRICRGMDINRHFNSSITDTLYRIGLFGQYPCGPLRTERPLAVPPGQQHLEKDSCWTGIQDRNQHRRCLTVPDLCRDGGMGALSFSGRRRELEPAGRRAAQWRDYAPPQYAGWSTFRWNSCPGPLLEQRLRVHLDSCADRGGQSSIAFDRHRTIGNDFPEHGFRPFPVIRSRNQLDSSISSSNRL
jgi:hypothetical protein